MKQAIAILLITLAAMQSEAREPAAIKVIKYDTTNILDCLKKHSGSYCDARLIEAFKELEKLSGPAQWIIKHSDDMKGNK